MVQYWLFQLFIDDDDEIFFGAKGLVFFVAGLAVDRLLDSLDD